MENIEIRFTGTFEKDPESRTIKGLAIPVESRSELIYGEFYETIQRSAISQDLIDNNDIKLYVNHDPSQGCFARSKYGNGSLHLFVTERGLEFETDLPDTEKGNELLQGIERRDYDALSFGFIAGKDHFDKKPNEDGTWNRYIDEIRMVDEISILSVKPAYSATNVNVRSLEDAKKQYEAEKLEVINSNLDAKMKEIEELAKFE